MKSPRFFATAGPEADVVGDRRAVGVAADMQIALFDAASSSNAFDTKRRDAVWSAGGEELAPTALSRPAGR